MATSNKTQMVLSHDNSTVIVGLSNG